MTVNKILEDYLKANGFDGLFYPGECSCVIGDLQPCGLTMLDCEPGNKMPCKCGQACDFDIGILKKGESDG